MLKLVIGNKNYSSWSMRPWLALRANDIPFEEIFIPLYTDQADKDRLLSFNPAGKVPALVDGDVTVWDSLSIIEYLAEKFPQSRLWPEDRAARAHARSISAEMHSGFMALRNECGMNLHRPIRAVALSDDAHANVARIQAIWAECHQRYGKAGPFLFGAFTGADAMFAPGGASLPHLCDSGQGRCAALCRGDECAAGVPAMDPRRAGRNAGHRAVRDGVNLIVGHALRLDGPAHRRLT